MTAKRALESGLESKEVPEQRGHAWQQALHDELLAGCEDKEQTTPYPASTHRLLQAGLGVAGSDKKSRSEKKNNKSKEHFEASLLIERKLAAAAELSNGVSDEIDWTPGGSPQVPYSKILNDSVETTLQRAVLGKSVAEAASEED